MLFVQSTYLVEELEVLDLVVEAGVVLDEDFTELLVLLLFVLCRCVSLARL